MDKPNGRLGLRFAVAKAGDTRNAGVESAAPATLGGDRPGVTEDAILETGSAIATFMGCKAGKRSRATSASFEQLSRLL